MGHQRQVLNVALVSTFAFHCAALALIPLIGAMVANIAHILLGFVWLVMLGTLLRRELSPAPLAGAPTPSVSSAWRDRTGRTPFWISRHPSAHYRPPPPQLRLRRVPHSTCCTNIRPSRKH